MSCPQEFADSSPVSATAKSIVDALQEAMKLIPRDTEDSRDVSDSAKIVVLRHGSSVSKARDVILQAGKPLHITEILQRIGKDDTKKNRISLSGSLASYVRDNVIFTRPGPNVFGLIELGTNPPDEVDQLDLEGIPPQEDDDTEPFAEVVPN